MAQDTFNWSLDLVKVAEAVINKLDKNKNGNAFLLKYAQLRKILSSVVAIKNKLSVAQRKSKSFDKLPNDIAMDVRFLKTTLLYQAGRIEESVGRGKKVYPVKQLIDISKLLNMIEDIGTDVKRFDLLCKYVEALVAFYKYRSVELSQSPEPAFNTNQNNRSSFGNR